SNWNSSSQLYSSFVFKKQNNLLITMLVTTVGCFLYFAFGSNLLKERLHLANPTATFVSTGRLKDYKLNFGLWGENVTTRWHGGVGTIEYSPGAEVWGVIWSLNNEDLANLDSQEGVKDGFYTPLTVSVETDKGPVVCRTYQMNNFYATVASPQYKEVVCLGAVQNNLPDEYVTRLKAVQTNNYTGPSLRDQIMVPSSENCTSLTSEIN
uniref:Gamma-glutamylcyclotransferase n=1 Tax=Nothobranchius furzeri TaxID=105023 RepID=A0A8C6M5A9_NOTFU